MHTGDIALLLPPLLLLLLSYYPAVLQIIVIVLGSRRRVSPRDLKPGKLIVLLPVKREPVELIEDFLKRNSHILELCEALYVIADEYPESEQRKILELAERYPKLKVVLRSKSRNKANALNEVVHKLPEEDDLVVLVLDVDAVVEKLPERYPDLACPYWRGYTRMRSLLGLGQIIGYEFYMKFIHALGRLTSWSPLAGSGLAARMSTLAKLGFFNEEVVLEDVELSIRGALRGVRPIPLPDLVVQVQVPATYSSFVKQQSRWAYGTAQLISTYFGKLLRKPIMLLYLAQYSAYPAQLLLSLLLYAYALAQIRIPLPIQLAVLLLAGVILGLYTYLIVLYRPHGVTLYQALVAVNRVNLAYSLAALRLLLSFTQGLLRLPYTWVPTPKLEQVARARERIRGLVPEIVQVLLLVAMLICLVLVRGASVFMSEPLLLLPLLFTVSSAWSLFRVLQRDLS